MKPRDPEAEVVTARELPEGEDAEGEAPGAGSGGEPAGDEPSSGPDAAAGPDASGGPGGARRKRKRRN